MRRQLPLICVILNNSTLAWIKHTAAARYPDAMVSQDFTEVSYADAAKALGAQVSHVDELSQFDLALKNAFASRTSAAVGHRGSGRAASRLRCLARAAAARRGQRWTRRGTERPATA